MYILCMYQTKINRKVQRKMCAWFFFVPIALVRLSASPFFYIDNENVGEPTTNATNIFHRAIKQNPERKILISETLKGKYFNGKKVQ